MDVNRISQVVSANYESNKVDKDNEKKHTEELKESVLSEGAAAEYEKSDAAEAKQTVKYDAATIEKMKAEAELKTAQLRTLVEKMLLKQGEQFTTLEDAFDMIKDGTIEVDDETVLEAQKEIADDGYWGVENTSERLFSFAKALAGNDPTKADSMLEALQRGYDEASKIWGGELPELCQKTFETTKQKLCDWRDSAAKDADDSVSATESSAKAE